MKLSTINIKEKNTKNYVSLNGWQLREKRLWTEPNEAPRESLW
jgi:hypothetical protein